MERIDEKCDRIIWRLDRMRLAIVAWTVFMCSLMLVGFAVLSVLAAAS